jgi:hypothetical protein
MLEFEPQYECHLLVNMSECIASWSDGTVLTLIFASLRVLLAQRLPKARASLVNVVLGDSRIRHGGGDNEEACSDSAYGSEVDSRSPE